MQSSSRYLGAWSCRLVFFVGNQRVVRSVELVGIVVSVDAQALKLTVYHVDDGTGVIPCVKFTTQEEQDDPAMRQSHELGSTICVQGRLSSFRDQRQVIINTCRTVDVNEETLGWLERLSLRQYLETSPFEDSQRLGAAANAEN
ncbi:hypothetical protein GQ54DRAFT_296275 [Martensiomyces pterosporus]|nr:hypothetical protein GQ54DRAFT_296275 [Martensiomyces pterosporus]